MSRRYSVKGWLDYVNDHSFEQLPKKVGVQFEHDEPMHIFLKSKSGYIPERFLYETELITFINSELIGRKQWQLIASNTYKPIFNLDLDYNISLGKIEKDYLNAYLHMWKDLDIIGFTKYVFNNGVNSFIEKTVSDGHSSIAFNIPNNKFLAMQQGKMYTLQELDLEEEECVGPGERVVTKDNDGVWSTTCNGTYWRKTDD